MVSPIKASEDFSFSVSPTAIRNRRAQDICLGLEPFALLELAIDFWKERDLKCLACANKSCYTIVKEQRNRILEKINGEPNFLKTIYREKKKKQLFGKNLEELFSLLHTWTRGEQKLRQLDLRGIGGIAVRYLQQIDSFCKEDAKVIVEALIKDCDQTSFSVQLEAYRPFFEGKENRSLALTVKSSTITEIAGYDFISEVNCFWCDHLQVVNLPLAKRGSFSMCRSLRTATLFQEESSEFLGCPALV